jgi:hypothetical protein
MSEILTLSMLHNEEPVTLVTRCSAAYIYMIHSGHKAVIPGRRSSQRITWLEAQG